MNSLLRTLSSISLAAGVGLSPVAHAAPASAPAAAAKPAAPIDAEKQKQIDRVLAVVHPEVGVLQAVQQQGSRALQQSGAMLQNSPLPQDRKEQAFKDIQGDVKKYEDTTMPVAIASAKKYTAPLSAPILAANFSTDELRQLAAMLESPLREKFEKVMPQLTDAVGQKVSTEIGPTVKKNTQEMGTSIEGRLRAAAAAPAGSAPK